MAYRVQATIRGGEIIARPRKETFTQDELGTIAIAFNAKIRELESAIEQLHDGDPLKAEYMSKLSDAKQVQQKAFRMYKFK